jgi:demethylmenaquinone methyltransferase/2-methoxy-6-polyprenyl-1,4-benzoquinol methylase
MEKTVKPSSAEGSKKEQVAEMFDNIAADYDFLNHFLSLGIDILWRRKAIRKLKPHKPKIILDVATGTGDFAIEALKLNPERVIGVDISSQMIAVGNEKLKKRKLDPRIQLQLGDSENLPFGDNTFDAITVAFGVRNFENLKQGLDEMLRVLKPDGHVAIIEFSQPTGTPFKQFYKLYFKHILPRLGRIVSKDSRAYTYLPESVDAFPYGQAFLDVMSVTGFTNASVVPLTQGIASLYLASK